ncbi:insulinase family protein, partial [Salinimicrobium oceani]
QERFANAGDFTFYFVGNIEEAELKKYATTYLASLPGSEEKEQYKIPDFKPDNSYHKEVVYQGKDPKSQVSIQWTGETEYDVSEDFALGALGEILTIKLVEQLREEEG